MYQLINNKRMSERFGKLRYYLDAKCAGMSGFHKACLAAESLFGRVFRGVTIEDYFQYHFYEKNRFGRSKYYTCGKREKLTNEVNDVKLAGVFTDKVRFVESFRKYIGRDIVDMRHIAREEFTRFTKGKDKIFFKPVEGSWGLGTSIEDCTGDNADALFDQYSGQSMMAEEVIRQCDALAQFNDTSTNSLRVVTFIDKNGEPFIMPGSILRLGRKGKIADNFHHEGIAAFVDNETGIVCTRGVDKKGNRYVVHPDSGIPIVGFQIPEWERIKALAKEAALVLPGVRCVGWDITITDDGRIVFIEGNDKADPDIAQMSLGEGVWESYRSMK